MPNLGPQAGSPESHGDARGRHRWTPLLAAGLLAVHSGLLAWSAFLHSPTQDEVAHLPAGLAVWRFGDPGVYRVNPPLVRSIAALPLLLVGHQEDWTGFRPGAPQRQEWRAGAQFVRANGERSWWLMTLARWACIPFSLLGGLVCWHWGSKLHGTAGGAVALALWCTSPNILGHGSLITPDVAAVANGLLAAYLFQQWRENRSMGTAFAAGLGLGLALLTKTYWVVLLMLWPLMAAVDLFRTSASGSAERATEGRSNGTMRHPPADRPRAPTIFGQVAVILAVGLNVLNLGYGFVGTGRPLGELPFFSRALAGETLNPERDNPANRFSGTWLGRVPIPVPADWLTGIDVQRADFELGKWSYLLGKTSEEGWWHYYTVGLAVKVPLGTWLLAAWGAMGAIRTSEGRGRLGRLAPLWLPAGLIFLLASSQTGINRHVRYVFPVLPVLFLLAAHAFRPMVAGRSAKPSAFAARMARPAVALLLAWSMLSSLRQYPHSLSYFNELAGGSQEGHRVLIDSNVDWGQDLSLVKSWLASHPQARPLRIAWLGFCDLRDVGIEVPLVNPDALTPGWYIVSVHLLHEPRGRYRRFLQMTPVDHIGSSMNVYRLDAEERQQTAGSP